MKKKNKAIIGISVMVVFIIVIIVGITVNNHQKTVKESESISASVETSKMNLISAYQKQYQNIISIEYKTEAEYDSAKKSLISLKSEIEKSDVKDAETIIALLTDIDNSINEYDDKINSLATHEEATEQTTITSKKTTEHNNGTTKSNSSNNTSKTGSNNTASKKQTTTNKQPITKKETTTQKNYKPNPAYGYATTSKPNYDDYAVDGWNTGRITYTWYEEVSMWGYECTYINGVSDEYAWRVYADKVFPEPNRKGKYDGEKVSSGIIYVWLG